MDVPLIVLEPGERLLWSGRPQRVVPTGLEWYRLVFGSILVSVVFAALGLPFPDGRVPVMFVVSVTVGLAFVWVPVIVRLRATRRSVYAVTDQRVVVADRVSGRIRTWTDLVLPTVTPIGHDGLGNLTFPVPGGSADVFGSAVPVKGAPAPIEMFAVPDARGLRDLIVQEQAED
ncbi:hypothetical protein [Amycolatopsis sp. RTGN1]|uniref:hypothetical protein n=1 Tax=Amycolatopsis ponsaeliensis TaxID=2992142 RepID=UPI002550F2E7|nr:hypothetical protein [Amycolatopsis sp. RTGN1]